MAPTPPPRRRQPSSLRTWWWIVALAAVLLALWWLYGWWAGAHERNQDLYETPLEQSLRIGDDSGGRDGGALGDAVDPRPHSSTVKPASRVTCQRAT